VDLPWPEILELFKKVDLPGWDLQGAHLKRTLSRERKGFVLR
jgi:hypothetical protein